MQDVLNERPSKIPLNAPFLSHASLARRRARARRTSSFRTIGLAQNTTAPRDAHVLRPARRAQAVGRAPRAGTTRSSQVETDQMGESRMDRNVKKFFVTAAPHRGSDARADANYWMAAVLVDGSAGREGELRTRIARARRDRATSIRRATRSPSRTAARALLLDAAHAHARRAARGAVPADEGRRAGSSGRWARKRMRSGAPTRWSDATFCRRSFATLARCS